MAVKDSKPNVFFFQSYSSIFHLGAWRNSIELFLGRGFQVVVVQFYDNYLYEQPSSLEKKYTLINVPFPYFIKAALYLIKIFFRSLKILGLQRLSSVGDGIAFLLKSIWYITFSFYRVKDKKSDIFICGDIPGLITVYLLSRRFKNIILYWSLELWIEKELPNFGMKIFKKLERVFNKYASATIDFGELRCRALREENKLPADMLMISIPNSMIGMPKLQRNNYYNTLFNIPVEKKMILSAGGIFADAKKVAKLWNYIPEWRSDCVFIIHSRTRSDIANKIPSPPSEINNTKYYYSENVVKYDELYKIYSSCDIGLILNGPTGFGLDSNHQISDLSIGKMFQYCYYGVPIIIRALRGYRELVENNGIGVTYRDESEIGDAINIILSSLDTYKKNCIGFSVQYRFEKHHEDIFSLIENKQISQQ